MSVERRPSRMAPVFGGAALAVLMIGLAVGQAEAITECQQCKSYWGYRAANDEKMCKNYPFRSYTDHRGTCIQWWIDQNCKEICKKNNVLTGIVSCTGDNAPGQCSNGATGICTMTTLGRTCDANNSEKRCKEANVPPGLNTASVCQVSCLCQ